MSSVLIPATILTGFLGSGKTTLLKRVLGEAHGSRIAVIENEFGEENIDNEILVQDRDEQIVQMSNGCICCTIRDDLRATLSDLAGRRRRGELLFDRVIIETTGVADPGPVAQTFFMDDDVASQYLLDSIVTLVDAVHAPQQLDTRLEAQRQVGFADRIFISKSDLADAAAVSQLQQRLRRMNPRAPQQLVHFGEVPLKEVLDLRGFNLNARLEIDPDFLVEQEHHDHAHDHHAHDHDHDHDHEHEHGGSCTEDHEHGPGCAHHHHHDDDVKSFVFRATQAFDPARLEEFLGTIVQIYGPRMLRYKGVLNMKGIDRKVVFQGVHQLMGSDLAAAWGPQETRESRIVFIGIDLPRDIIEQGLRQALVA